MPLMTDSVLFETANSKFWEWALQQVSPRLLRLGCHIEQSHSISQIKM